MPRGRSSSGSPTSLSTNSIPVAVSPAGPPKKKYTNVQTNTDKNYNCQKCQEREFLNLTDSEDFRTNYIKSINYINACHSIMNELLAQRGAYNSSSKVSVLMPDLPNFLDIYAVLQESPANSQQSSTESSKTVISVEKKQHKDDTTQKERQEKREEKLGDFVFDIKPKTNIMQLIPDIKSSEEFQELERTLSSKPKPSKFKNSKDVQKNYSETNWERTAERREDRNEKSRSAFNMGPEEHEKQTKSLQKNSHSVQKEEEGIRQRIERGGAEDSYNQNILDKYSKRLLESTENSRQSSPRKGLSTF